MPKLEITDEQANIILGVIESQDFHEFFGSNDGTDDGTPMDLYVTGDSEAPSKNEVLTEIKRLFRRLG